ncbi:MAG: peptidylprolyl isomerase [Moraxellaceae bacterium]|jgi:FKBP-type peptidyl-prolyl cis-trans isomerase SlpA|nr:peptidylprolyl isomerase [Moraxellaceae bacterium]
MSERIGPGKKVTLHFSVALADGEVVDSTRPKEVPAVFTVGDGSLLPGFEKALFGLKEGDRRSVFIDAKHGFGDWNADNQQVFTKVQFSGMQLEPGLVISFADKSGELPGVVKEVGEETVTVDFNHPLAGRDLVFEVDIIRVMDADAAPVTLGPK